MIMAQSVGIAIERACQEILLSRFAPSPRGKPTKELVGQMIMISNPRARIVTSRFRSLNLGMLFGRFLWEVGGNDDLESISYYDANAIRFAKGSTIPTAYGHRLLSYGKSGIDQVGRGIQTLRADPDSRRATGLILTPIDSPSTSREYPCIIGYQTLIREGYLNMIVYMRSSSIWAVFPIDVFLFTMLQEMIAHELGIEVGYTTYMIGSMHFYAEDLKNSITHVMNHGMMEIPYEMGNLFTNNSPPLTDLVDAEMKIRKGKSNFNFSTSLLVKHRSEEWAQILHTLIVYKNMMEKEDNIESIPSFRALNPTYRAMMLRHVHPIGREDKDARVEERGDKGGSKLEEPRIKKRKHKKTVRVPIKTTKEQSKSKPVAGDSKPGGWVSDV